MSTLTIILIWFLITWPIAGLLTCIWCCYIDKQPLTLRDLFISLFGGWVFFIVMFKFQVIEKANSIVILNFTKKENKE